MNPITIEFGCLGADPVAERGQARATLERPVMAERQPGREHRPEPPARPDRRRAEHLELAQGDPLARERRGIEGHKIVPRAGPEAIGVAPLAVAEPDRRAIVADHRAAEREPDAEPIGQVSRQGGDDLAGVDADLGRAPVAVSQPLGPNPGGEPAGLVGVDQPAAQPGRGRPVGELGEYPGLVVAVGQVERTGPVVPEPGLFEYGLPGRHAAQGQIPRLAGRLADRPEHPKVAD